MELILKRQQDGRRAAPEAPAPFTPPELPEPSAPAALGPAAAQVIYGASVQTMPLAGLTVSQAREIAAAVLQVDRRAPCLVNGHPVSRDYVIQADDTIEYVHFAGEKGRGHSH